MSRIDQPDLDRLLLIVVSNIWGVLREPHRSDDRARLIDSIQKGFKEYVAENKD